MIGAFSSFVFKPRLLLPGLICICLSSAALFCTCIVCASCVRCVTYRREASEIMLSRYSVSYDQRRDLYFVRSHEELHHCSGVAGSFGRSNIGATT